MGLSMSSIIVWNLNNNLHVVFKLLFWQAKGNNSTIKQGRITHSISFRVKHHFLKFQQIVYDSLNSYLFIRRSAICHFWLLWPWPLTLWPRNHLGSSQANHSSYKVSLMKGSLDTEQKQIWSIWPIWSSLLTHSSPKSIGIYCSRSIILCHCDKLNWNDMCRQTDKQDKNNYVSS